jgi:hypothetical protein
VSGRHEVTGIFQYLETYQPGAKVHARRARSLPKSRISNRCIIPTIGARLSMNHMKRESVFRSITAALLVTAAAISGYHHRAEQAGGGEISLQEEGLPIAVGLRSSGLVLIPTWSVPRTALTAYRARLGRKSWFPAWLIWPLQTRWIFLRLPPLLRGLPPRWP